jgi:negative regulator of replication initiation
LRTNWKWIRVNENLYHEIASLGEFGDSFNDIIRKCADSYVQGRGEAPTAMGSHEVKARLKKFDSHTKAIARLVKENISYTNND